MLLDKILNKSYTTEIDLKRKKKLYNGVAAENRVQLILQPRTRPEAIDSSTVILLESERHLHNMLPSHSGQVLSRVSLLQ